MLGGEQPAKTAKTAKTSRPKPPTKRTRADVLAKSQAADQAVLELLRSTPNMTTAQIAAALEANKSTTGQRIQRLADRGQVRRDDDSGCWSAIA